MHIKLLIIYTTLYETLAIMSPTLYHVPRTISSPIVQVLYELNLIETKKVNVETLTFPQLKAPEHLARNPMGTSPAFTDDEHDIAIWESGAVLTYILEFYDLEHKLHPPTGSSAKERATFLHLQQFIIATVYPFLASLFIHSLKPIDEQDAIYMASAKEKFTTLLGPTLVKFLGSSEYFMGDKISAIDFLATKPLGNAHSLGLLKDFPTLDELYHKIQCMPSYAIAYDEKVDLSTHGRSMILVPDS